MQIVNIIEIKRGIVSKVVSFPITDNKKESSQVKKAEELFIKLAKTNGLEKEDEEEVLDNGTFENMAGYEVVINWSEEVKL